MLPSALAIGAVAAVVLLLIGIFGQSGGDPTAGATTPPAGAPTSTAPTTPASTPVTSPPVTTATSTPTPTVTTPDLPTEFPDILTVVLNSTSESGLAGRVSAYLGSLGWAVGPIGNFEATTETTTVYYPEGYEEEARALAAVSPGSGDTVAPVTDDVSADTLTVVLGEDAVDWVEPDSAEEPPTGEPSTAEPSGG